MAGAPIASSILTGINALMTCVNTVSNIGRERLKIEGEFNSICWRLELEVKLAERDLEKFEGRDDGLSMLLLEQLCKIEDYIAILATEPEEKLKSYLAMGTRIRMVKEIESLLGQMKTIQDQLKETEKTSPSADLHRVTAGCHLPEEDLAEKFREDMRRLREMIAPVDGGKMRRLAIVGCGGLGKSSLAKALFEAVDVKSTYQSDAAKYCCKIWVQATRCKDAEDILKQIVKAEPVRGSTIFEKAKKILEGKKFFVVIDDLCSSNVKWKNLEKAFPDNSTSSRIILTTNLQSAGKDFSSGRCLIYHVQPLSECDARILFWKKAFGTSPRIPTIPEVNRSVSILAKCQGLPVALISAGDYICSKDKRPFLSEDLGNEVCSELSNVVASEAMEFRYMRRSYAQYYENLQDQDERMSLLYFSLFPQGCHINRKAFITKLSAEGLIAKGSAEKNLKQLIDKCHIRNIDKKLEIQGMLLEFVICKASAQNLMTVVEDGIIRLNKHDRKFGGQSKPPCRRLSIQFTKRTSNPPIPVGLDISNVGSLTIFPCKDPVIVPMIDQMKFKYCTLMRVLDLEGCRGFKDSNALASICELLLLRFLNLKYSDIERLPNRMENLKQLETLDIRHTQANVLNWKVITLPEISNIYGEFVLPALPEMEHVATTTFLRTKSKLETLEGLRLSKDSGFHVVVVNAKSLKRIKMCGETFLQPSAPAPSPASSPGPSDSEYRKAVDRLLRNIYQRRDDWISISIESTTIIDSFMRDPMAYSLIRYLKLEGAISALFNNCQLNKMCLYETGRSFEAIVQALQSLPLLEHLKLGKEHQAGEFSVEQNGFPALRHLCFKGKKNYPKVTIAEGAMPMLATLELRCSYSPEDRNEEIIAACAGIMIEGIDHLNLLEEVILDHTADNDLVKAWEASAMAHPNLPCVRRQGKPANNVDNC